MRDWNDLHNLSDGLVNLQERRPNLNWYSFSKILILNSVLKFIIPNILLECSAVKTFFRNFRLWTLPFEILDREHCVMRSMIANIFWKITILNNSTRKFQLCTPPPRNFRKRTLCYKSHDCKHLYRKLSIVNTSFRNSSFWTLLIEFPDGQYLWCVLLESE